MGKSKQPVGKPKRVKTPKRAQSSVLDSKPRHFLLTAVKIENTGDPENIADGLWNAIHGALTTLPLETQQQVLDVIKNRIDVFMTAKPLTSIQSR